MSSRTEITYQELEDALTAMTADRDSHERILRRMMQERYNLQTQLDGMSEAYENVSQGRYRDWIEYEESEAITLDDLGHAYMRIRQLERA